MLEASSNDSLGQTMCTWSTFDEADDDLSSALVTAQVFSGDPVPASNLIDPESSTRHHDRWRRRLGVLRGSFGINDCFLDEPIAGSLGYSEFQMGDPELPPRHSPDEITELFRTFHDRVT